MKIFSVELIKPQSPPHQSASVAGLDANKFVTHAAAYVISRHSNECICEFHTRKNFFH
jgi:hypothetical protein